MKQNPPGKFDSLINEIGRLPHTWHDAGSVSESVLKTIVKYAGDQKLDHTAETGSGKTTLLFSHLSHRHEVFAVEWTNHSISAVRDSTLCNREVIEFIEGPTQHTLPRHHFNQPLQMVLLDGPHGYPFPDIEYYYFYPHLQAGGSLIVDDIHIPSIYRMFEILKEDAMFKLLEVVATTAFFRRTSAPTLPVPNGDGWWEQGYNKKLIEMPVGIGTRIRRAVSPLIPKPARDTLKRAIRARPGSR